MTTPKPQSRQSMPRPTLRIPNDLKAAYSNMVRISHQPSEVVLEFAQKLPGPQPAVVVSQVLMSPISVKLFHQALADNIKKYESTFGEIKIPVDASLAEYSKLFRPPSESPEEGHTPPTDGTPT